MEKKKRLNYHWHLFTVVFFESSSLFWCSRADCIVFTSCWTLVSVLPIVATLWKRKKDSVRSGRTFKNFLFLIYFISLPFEALQLLWEGWSNQRPISSWPSNGSRPSPANWSAGVKWYKVFSYTGTRLSRSDQQQLIFQVNHRHHQQSGNSVYPNIMDPCHIHKPTQWFPPRWLCWLYSLHHMFLKDASEGICLDWTIQVNQSIINQWNQH